MSDNAQRVVALLGPEYSDFPAIASRHNVTMDCDPELGVLWFRGVGTRAVAVSAPHHAVGFNGKTEWLIARYDDPDDGSVVEDATVKSDDRAWFIADQMVRSIDAEHVRLCPGIPEASVCGAPAEAGDRYCGPCREAFDRIPA